MSYCCSAAGSAVVLPEEDKGKEIILRLIFYYRSLFLFQVLLVRGPATLQRVGLWIQAKVNIGGKIIFRDQQAQEM